jgi:RNA polymerase sigma-70 factor (ECF subfamily)
VRQFFFRAAPLETAGAAAIASEDNSENDNLVRLDVAIAALPVQLKEPLLLTAFEGMSQQETADALGLTVKAIETRVYRARKLLAEALTKTASNDEDG